MCGDTNLLVFGVRIEMDSVFVSGHRNRLGIRVETEINLISVIGSQLACFLLGIETDLVSVWVSKFTCFLRGGSKLFFFAGESITI